MKAEILPPLSATLRVKPAGWRTGFKLWLPLFLVWLFIAIMRKSKPAP